jgi:hypothetical protein
MYPRGHIDDHPAVVARRLGLHLFHGIGAMRASSLSRATTNRAKLWGLWNQFDSSGCEGCDHSSGITLRLAVAGTPLSEPVSNVGLYLGALTVDRVPNADGTLPPLLDSGTMPSSILTAASTWGSVGASVWGQQPMSSGTLYQKPSDSNSPLIAPPPEKFFAESNFKLNGAYFVQSTGLQKVLDILVALTAGFPVSIAIPASGQDFQGYSGGVIGATTGPVDHANLIVDYTWTGTQDQFTAWQGGASGLDGYLVGHGVNSWGGVGCKDGGTWGEVDSVNGLGGQYRFNRSFFDQAQDSCILDIKKAA